VEYGATSPRLHKEETTMNRKIRTTIATLAALTVAVAIAPGASAAPVAKPIKTIETSADLHMQAIRGLSGN
jgi:hypothetical protein